MRYLRKKTIEYEAAASSRNINPFVPRRYITTMNFLGLFFQIQYISHNNNNNNNNILSTHKWVSQQRC